MSIEEMPEVVAHRITIHTDDAAQSFWINRSPTLEHLNILALKSMMAFLLGKRLLRCDVEPMVEGLEADEETRWTIYKPEEQEQ